MSKDKQGITMPIKNYLRAEMWDSSCEENNLTLQ